MAEEQINYNSFINYVPFELVDKVNSLNNYLLENGNKIEIKPAARAPVVSYVYKKDKKTLFNYVFRKNAFIARLYPTYIEKYQDILKTFPESITNVFKVASACRECNQKCPKGYRYIIDDVPYYVCRYNLLIPLSPDNFEYVETLIKNEMQSRDIN